jgi:hypothetical protein
MFYGNNLKVVRRRRLKATLQKAAGSESGGQCFRPLSENRGHSVVGILSAFFCLFFPMPGFFVHGIGKKCMATF